MAEEEVAPQQAEKKGGGKGILIVLIVLIVVLIGVVGAGGYFLYSKGVFSDTPPAEQATTEKKAESSDDNEFFQVAINDLVLNITNAKGREKLMKLSFSLKSIEPTIESFVEANKAEIVDVVIQQISARSSEELLTVGGKELLKEELIDEINRVLNEAAKGNEDIKQSSIKKIFFTTFVIK